jgi:hypothetical protein
MTAKEKAEELISSYRFALSIPNAPLGEYKDSVAVQCALISVNEIQEIKSVSKDDTLSNYWEEVEFHLRHFKNKNNV